MRVVGKVALITGAGNELDERVAAEIGEGAVSVHLDVTSESSWQGAVAETVARFGGLDILVSNAGMSGAQFRHLEQ